MTVKDWIKGKKTALFLGLVMTGLTLFVVVFGSYKLYSRKRRQHQLQDEQAAVAQGQRVSDIELGNLTGPPVIPDDNAFGIVALQRGIYGGVQQTSTISPAPPNTSIDNVIAARRAARNTNASSAPAPDSTITQSAAAPDSTIMPDTTIVINLGNRLPRNEEAPEGSPAHIDSSPLRMVSSITHVQPSSLIPSDSLRARYLGLPAFTTFVSRRRRASEIFAPIFPSQENRSATPVSAASLTPPPSPGVPVQGVLPEIALQSPSAEDGATPKVYGEDEHHETGESHLNKNNASVGSLNDVYDYYGSDAPASESGEPQDQGLEVNTQGPRRFSRMPSRALL